MIKTPTYIMSRLLYAKPNKVGVKVNISYGLFDLLHCFYLVVSFNLIHELR